MAAPVVNPGQPLPSWVVQGLKAQQEARLAAEKESQDFATAQQDAASKILEQLQAGLQQPAPDVSPQAGFLGTLLGNVSSAIAPSMGGREAASSAIEGTKASLRDRQRARLQFMAEQYDKQSRAAQAAGHDALAIKLANKGKSADEELAAHYGEREAAIKQQEANARTTSANADLARAQADRDRADALAKLHPLTQMRVTDLAQRRTALRDQIDTLARTKKPDKNQLALLRRKLSDLDDEIEQTWAAAEKDPSGRGRLPKGFEPVERVTRAAQHAIDSIKSRLPSASPQAILTAAMGQPDSFYADDNLKKDEVIQEMRALLAAPEAEAAPNPLMGFIGKQVHAATQFPDSATVEANRARLRQGLEGFVRAMLQGGQVPGRPPL
jgi:chromosome segregation ATPase